VRQAGGLFASDRATEALVDDPTLRGAAGPGEELTYTCVPAGAGERAGIDRDEDGYFDRDELDAGSDPADPTSTPGNIPPDPAVVLIPGTKLVLKDDVTIPIDPGKRRIVFTSITKQAPPANRIVPPLPGSLGDPTAGGATLIVYNSAGLSTDVVTVNLPAAGWIGLGSQNPKGWRFRGASGDPITSVVVKSDRIVLRGGKSTWGYSLDESAQGRIAVQLRLGTDPGWCAEVTPKLKGSPPSTAASDRPGLFKGARGGAAPAACPAQ